MATAKKHAKSKARSAASRKGVKKAAPKRSVAAAKKPKASAKAKPAPKQAKPAPKQAKPVAKPAKPAKAKAAPKVIGKPAVKGPTRPAGAAAKAVAGPKKTRPENAPVVRPIGVLPPESRARASDRPSSPAGSRFLHPPLRPNAPRPSTLGAQPVTEKDLKDFEGRLLAERAKIMKEMGHIETNVLKQNQRDSSGDLSGYSFHMADAGTDAYEREKAFLLASTEGRALMEVDEALRRLYRGEYGVCEECGNPIAKARLEAMPHARLCVTCKEKQERAAKAGPTSQ